MAAANLSNSGRDGRSENDDVSSSHLANLALAIGNTTANDLAQLHQLQQQQQQQQQQPSSISAVAVLVLDNIKTEENSN